MEINFRKTVNNPAKYDAARDTNFYSPNFCLTVNNATKIIRAKSVPMGKYQRVKTDNASPKNTALNFLKRNSRYTYHDIENMNKPCGFNTDTPEDTILKKEWIENIRIAVANLPPKCQMAYRLVREEGLRYRDVAAIMEISENTVDRHLNKAVRKLVKTLKIYLGLGKRMLQEKY